MATNLCKKCGEQVEGDAACPSCGAAQTVVGRRPRPRSGRYSPGECIDGKYEVVMTLGSGGMGELYKVRHLHLNDFRAVKVLRADQVSDEMQKRRFLREAKVAASIKHDNLASLYDFSSAADGSFYMVEEYIDGITIAQHMRRGGRFTVRDVVAVADQVLSGLAAMHEGGIIHRDISPDNLMLARMQGRTVVKIIDMGIAKPVIEAGEGLTSAGFFIGKPHYASPEQMKMIETTEKIDHRTDLYSLGIVLYEMIVGRVPFVANTPIEYIIKQATEEIVAINKPGDLPMVPPDLEAFVIRLLKINRNERFANAEEAREVLSGVGVPRPWMIETKLMPTVQTLVPELEAEKPQPTVVRDQDPPVDTTTEVNPLPKFASQHGKTPVLVREGDPESGDEEPEESTAEFAIPKMKPPAGAVPGMAAKTMADLAPTSPRTMAEVAPSSAPTLYDTAVEPEPRTAPVRVPTPRASPPPPPPSPAAVKSDPRAVPTRKPVGPAALLGVLAIVLIVAAGLAFWLWKGSAKEAPGSVVREVESKPPIRDQTEKLETREQVPPALETKAPVLNGPPPVVTETQTSVSPVADTPVQAQKPPVSEKKSSTESSTGTAERSEQVAERKTPVERKTPAERKVPAERKTPADDPGSQPVAEVTQTAEPTPEPPPVPGDVQVGDLVTPGPGVVDAKVTKRAPPVYPLAAVRMRARGNVRVNVLINHEGKIEDVRILVSSGISAMDQEAIIAARKSRYEPATKNGVPVRIWKAMDFQFRP